MMFEDASPYRCRFCSSPLRKTFVDLGLSPLCQTHIEPRQLNAMEPFYPLHCFVCEQCWLVQLPEHVGPREIFEEYAYFSSYSETWLRHAADHVERMSNRLRLNAGSLVIEIASNDGYLLQNFVARGIPVLGIEPARNVARVAVEKGIPTCTEFFGRELAGRLALEGRHADLVIGNNVLAHVPDINDFVAGMKLLLKPEGVITMEFPHLLRLVDGNQFDTIYHEHFSYLSLFAVEQIFSAHDLTVFEVDELTTHGGSLRIYARHAVEGSSVTDSVLSLRSCERQWGVSTPEPYRAFSARVRGTKRAILGFLIETRNAGKSIVGYGAPGKGNTLLNYCGIRTDFLDYTVDRNPYKQGKYTPGTRIPILPPSRIPETKPDYLFILPWNLKEEVMAQMAFIREWGGRFVVPIPEVKVYD